MCGPSNEVSYSEEGTTFTIVGSDGSLNRQVFNEAADAIVASVGIRPTPRIKILLQVAGLAAITAIQAAVSKLGDDPEVVEAGFPIDFDSAVATLAALTLATKRAVHYARLGDTTADDRQHNSEFAASLRDREPALV